MLARKEYTYSYDVGRITLGGKCEISVKSTNAAIAEINPYRYRGFYFDNETGFYYLQSRYYDPEVGRFINADAANIITLLELPNDKNLYVYCNNEPSFNYDNGGCLSFSSVKKAIKNIVNNLKNFIKNLVDYIKKQFKKFISKVSCHFNKGYFTIPTVPIGYLIDAVIATVSGIVKATLLKGGFSLVKLWFKSNKPALKAFVKDTVIPMLKNTSGLLNSLIKFIAMRFGWKMAWTVTKSKIENAIWGKYSFYRWISAVSSVGSFVATVLDILDGKWNDCLAV